MAKTTFDIAVLPGDGIGIDVIAEAVKVLNVLQGRSGSFRLNLKEYPCGALCYQQTGEDLPGATLEAVRAADAVLLGAMGHPDIRKSDGTELVPQVTLRVLLDLYAGVRPCKLYPGARSPLAGHRPGDIDLVILREQTEGLFASQNAGIVLGNQVATDTLVMTRPGIRRICEFAFRLAREREQGRVRKPDLQEHGRVRKPDLQEESRAGKPDLQGGKVTCVDKANIFKSFAFFRRVFDEVAREYPDIQAEHTYIDAQALFLVQKPERFDVLVTENMFGDILSDLGAGLVGGMGMAPSADIGDRHGVFQPAHGTAPDIAGQGIANPLAAILSAGLMLDWLGRHHGQPELVHAARRIDQAVTLVLAEANTLPVDQGGKASTAAVGNAICQTLEKIK